MPTLPFIPSIRALPSLPRRYRPLNIVLSDPSNPDLVCAETRAAINLWKRQLVEDAAEAMNEAMNETRANIVGEQKHLALAA